MALKHSNHRHRVRPLKDGIPDGQWTVLGFDTVEEANEAFSRAEARGQVQVIRA